MFGADQELAGVEIAELFLVGANGSHVGVGPEDGGDAARRRTRVRWCRRSPSRESRELIAGAVALDIAADVRLDLVEGGEDVGVGVAVVVELLVGEGRVCDEQDAAFQHWASPILLVRGEMRGVSGAREGSMGV